MTLTKCLGLTPKEFVIDCVVMKLTTTNQTVATFFIGDCERMDGVSRTVTLPSNSKKIPSNIRDTFASNLLANDLTRRAIDSSLADDLFTQSILGHALKE